MDVRQTPGGDEGFTLVECLLAIAILGVAIAALLGGMRSTILGADIHRGLSEGGALLIQAAEAVEDESRNPFQNLDCATGTTTYNPYTGVTLPTGWAPKPGYTPLSITSVQHWNGTTFESACTAGFGLQRISITVESPDSRAERTLEIVKRAP